MRCLKILQINTAHCNRNRPWILKGDPVRMNIRSIFPRDFSSWEKFLLTVREKWSIVSHFWKTPSSRRQHKSFSNTFQIGLVSPLIWNQITRFSNKIWEIFAHLEHPCYLLVAYHLFKQLHLKAWDFMWKNTSYLLIFILLTLKIARQNEKMHWTL